ncbi:MAG: protein phosphatase 2C domain-containing protein [Actinomycetia bacterium]|nr:protein phosphatase 2C domain-containing protein [Actinomycetes bacterium]
MSAGGRLVLRCAADQRIGDREHQNDRFAAGDLFIVVSDGMGARPEAGPAAQAVVDGFAQFARAVPPAAIPDGLLGLPADLVRRLGGQPSALGATLAGAVLEPDGRLWLVTVGDSRVLLLRGHQLVYASQLDNAAAVAARMGYESTDPAAEHRLERYLAAADGDPTPTIALVQARAGDVVVAVTDGVDRVVSPLVLSWLAAGSSGPGELVLATLAEARERGMSDNGTVAVGVVERGA